MCWARQNELVLSDKIVNFALKYPNEFAVIRSLEFTTLTPKDVMLILTYYGIFENLIGRYGYNAKALFKYIDWIATYEAIDNYSWLIREIKDYAYLMQKVSIKFEKYPKHFLTTHRIATRNYERMRAVFQEESFQKRIDKSLERTFGEYRFYYPETTQAIKDEAAQQNNCVASYIQKVIDGKCHIMFLRKIEEPNKSLVTIEVRDGRIVQALGKYNRELNEKERDLVDAWNKWKKNKEKSDDQKRNDNRV